MEKAKKTKNNPKSSFMEEPLPQNPEAESVVLGAFIIGHPNCDELAETVEPEDFFSKENRIVWLLYRWWTWDDHRAAFWVS